MSQLLCSAESIKHKLVDAITNPTGEVNCRILRAIRHIYPDAVWYNEDGSSPTQGIDRYFFNIAYRVWLDRCLKMTINSLEQNDDVNKTALGIMITDLECIPMIHCLNVWLDCKTVDGEGVVHPLIYQYQDPVLCFAHSYLAIRKPFIKELSKTALKESLNKVIPLAKLSLTNKDRAELKARSLSVSNH